MQVYASRSCYHFFHHSLWKENITTWHLFLKCKKRDISTLTQIWILSSHVSSLIPSFQSDAKQICAVAYKQRLWMIYHVSRQSSLVIFQHVTILLHNKLYPINEVLLVVNGWLFGWLLVGGSGAGGPGFWHELVCIYCIHMLIV